MVVQALGLRSLVSVRLAWRRNVQAVSVAVLQPQRSMGSYQDRKRKYKKQMAEQLKTRQKQMTEMQKKQMGEIRMTPNSPGVIADSCIPLMPEEKAPLFSKEGLRQRWTHFKKRVVNLYCVGMLRRSIKDWKPLEFAETALDMFKRTNVALGHDDKSALRELLTDNAFMSFRKAAQSRRMLEVMQVVERPRVVNVITFPVNEKTNLFAQVTVRLSTKQRMLHLDQVKNGRPVAGDVKDVVDYVVLERHIVKPDSDWRICGKLIPESELRRTMGDAAVEKMLAKQKEELQKRAKKQ